MAEKLAKKTFWNTLWSLFDTILTKGVTFLIGIILARILSPSDFGLVGMMLVFVALCDTFIESGISNALIRKLDRNTIDFNTAFMCNIMMGIFAYAVLYYSSPFIANFYNEESLEQLLKVFGINVLLISLSIVPNAIIISSFRIKDQVKVNFYANIIAGGLAIAAALNGFGVWALIIQTVTTNLVKTIGYHLLVKWRITFVFSKDSFRYLVNYGSKSLLIGLIGTLFYNLYNLLIGKFFTKSDLGYYTRANQFGQFPVSILQSAIQKVTVATFSNLQYDKPHLKDVYRKYVHIISFIVFPSLFVISVLSKPIILFFLTKKWLDSIIILQILCIGFAFSPLGILNLCLLQAINRIDYSLKLEIAKKAIYIVIILISFPMGIIPMVIGASFNNIVGTLMNLSCSKRFIDYFYFEQLKDMGGYLLLTLITSSIVYPLIVFTDISNFLKLLVGCVAFSLIYLALCYVIKVKALKYVVELKTKVK